jgi:putative ABC transport system permease protein
MDPDAPRLAILTDGFWRQRLNGDPSAIGRTIRVDGSPRIVVGILPASFRFLSSKARLFFPLVSSPQNRAASERHSGSSSQMLARLRPGVSIESAQAEIDAHNAAVEAGSATAKMMAGAGFRSLVMPLHAEHVAAVRPVLLFVQAGALCLLLIGGVNLVNLLLIRATARSRELAVRQAIGGSRARIVRQVIVETTVLSVAGALLGLALGAIGIRLLGSVGTRMLPLGAQVAFDGPLAAAGIAGALAIGLAMALPVAWYSLRNPAAAVLSFESRAITAGPGVQRLRHAFLVAQVALAFALLAAAGLLAVSLRRVVEISPGFRSANVLSGQMSVPVRAYPDTAARRALVDRLMTALERQPGIAAAGIVTNVPFSGHDNKSAITVEGYVPPAGESVRGHYGYGVGGRYFDAIGLSLVEGRFLTPQDVQRDNHVVVVDEDFARHYWPGASAIGHRIYPGPREDGEQAFTVVGVAGSAKQTGLTDTASTGAVFFPYTSRFDTELFVLARTVLPPESLASTMRQAVHETDPDLAVSDIRSMDTRIADSLVARRSPAVLAGVFSALALLLTAIGTYGVVSYAVATRRREIALRIALGATPGLMRRQFVSLSLRLVGIGSVLGLAAAWVAGGAMRTILYGVPPLHLPTLAATAAIMGLISLAACVLPAVRAARVSPAEVLSA